MTSKQMSFPLREPLSEKELCPEELLSGQKAAFARDIERLHARQSEFIAVRCPACSSNTASPAFEKYGFFFSSCSECKTIYMSPRPSPEVIADYYANSENYAYWAKHIFPASERARREKIHKPWLNLILKYCDRFGIQKGQLVEVGPGFGTFSELAIKSEMFSKVLAIEPTPEMAIACRIRGVDVIEKRIEDISDNDMKRADLLVAFEVIEHLFDPATFVSQCAGILCPGGLLVLSCPNGLGFDIDILGDKSPAVDAEHINLFNPTSISHLLIQTGFKVLEVSTPGRLDAELVRDAAIRGEIDLTKDKFLTKVLLTEWDKMKRPFQSFLAENGLSSHMWIVAQNKLD